MSIESVRDIVACLQNGVVMGVDTPVELRLPVHGLVMCF